MRLVVFVADHKDIHDQVKKGAEKWHLHDIFATDSGGDNGE